MLDLFKLLIVIGILALTIISCAAEGGFILLLLLSLALDHSGGFFAIKIDLAVEIEDLKESMDMV